MSEKTSPPSHTLFVLLLLALALQLVLLALAPGCAHSGPPPQPPPVSFRAAPCEGFVPEPTDIDVCEGRFTVDGLACVRCDVSAGCLHGRDVVYCTPACSDPECAFGGGR